VVIQGAKFPCSDTFSELTEMVLYRMVLSIQTEIVAPFQGDYTPVTTLEIVIRDLIAQNENR